MNLCFLGSLVLGGLLLLRTDRRGLRVCNFLFVAEVLYWIGTPLIGFYLTMSLTTRRWAAGVSSSVAGATGIGNMGLAPQILTGYPIIALVLLNLAFRRLARRAEVRAS